MWVRGFCIFKIYFLFCIVLLLILWPGTWSWDDLWMLDTVSKYTSWNPWQNVLTGIYFDLLLQVLPFPGGIILIQNLMISICVAFCITRLESTSLVGKLNNTSLDIILKILPFILPPIIMYQFSGYRCGMSMYLELMMVVELLARFNADTAWDVKHMILFCLLVSVVARWRSESFIYIPCIIVLLLVMPTEIIKKHNKILSIVIIITLFVF